MHHLQAESRLKTAEAAMMPRADATTVTRWAGASKPTFTRTLGEHRRYRQAEVRALITSDRLAGA
ncbi:MerR family DNA-binding transcriptional regulator [Nonomuraea wenchangensis]|uniref:MerR family DNA-binding transcriptional regulator n=1 Tax=Nonomuraea wenchangensis TaxID=568860 RepID=UPI003425950D